MMKFTRTVSHIDNTTDTLVLEIEPNCISITMSINQPAKGPIQKINADLKYYHVNQYHETSNTWDVITSSFADKQLIDKFQYIRMINHAFPFSKQEVLEIAKILGSTEAEAFKELPKRNPRIDEVQQAKTLESKIAQLESKVASLEEQLNKLTQPSPRPPAKDATFFNVSMSSTS